MASYNRCIFLGNMTKDAETKQTTSGKSVTSFTLAVNNPRKKDEAPLYIDAQAWDKAGETIATYAKKGSPLLIEGRLTIRPFEDKDGNKRKATRLTVDNFQLLGGAPKNGATNGAGEAEAEAAAASAGNYASEIDDEVPF